MSFQIADSQTANPWWNRNWTTFALGLLVVVLSTLLLWPTASAVAGALRIVAEVLVENGRVGWGILWLVMSVLNLGEIVGELAL
jgi:hypothetical protein